MTPPHPGLTWRHDVLPALVLSVIQAAAQLGVPRVALSRALNGRAAISPEMALRWAWGIWGGAPSQGARANASAFGGSSTPSAKAAAQQRRNTLPGSAAAGHSVAATRDGIHGTIYPTASTAAPRPAANPSSVQSAERSTTEEWLFSSRTAQRCRRATLRWPCPA